MRNQPNPQLEPLLVTEREAARLLGRSVEALRSMRRRGQVRHLRAGARVFYRPSDLRAYVEALAEGKR